MSQPSREELAAEILRQVEARDGSICPSEVARAVGGEDWRALMAPVRREAAALSEAGRLEILRKGRVIPPAEMHGVIRLRQKAPTTPE